VINTQELHSLVAKHTTLWIRTLRLIGSVVPFWTVAWIALLILLGVAPGVTIYLTKLSIDSIIAVQAGTVAVNTAVLYLVLTGISFLSTEVLNGLMTWVRTSQEDILTNHLKDLIHKKASEVDLAFYESSSYFDLLEQVRGNSITRPLALLESFGSVLQSTITLLTFSTLLVSYGWWVPLVLLVGAVPALAIFIRSERLMQRWVLKTTQDRRWLSYFDATLTTNHAAQETRIFGLSEHFRRRYQELSLRLRLEKLGHVKRQLSGRLIAAAIALLTAAGAMGWMALRVFNNLATLGDLAVFYQVFSKAQSLMQSLLGGVNRTFSNNFYLEILFEFLDIEPEIVSRERTVPFPAKIEHGIEFNNLTFSYPGSEYKALDDFSLFIPAGKLAAIVGVNGAGKSTLIKLLCRFYDPQKGDIKIDGTDLRDFDVTDLQRNLSAYFQFPIRYHETVTQNIAFGDIDRPVDVDRVQSAAVSSGADALIQNLTRGYETLLGKHFADGSELSGGQWQRLTLARAYYRKAPIMFLDEPTSFMDSWSEAEWFEHLRELVTGQTGLIITHRFTIAMRADIIHVVDSGKIIESGTHNQLIAADGFYAESWRSQMNGGS
jgi:ATP-binding cassette subfamily B protein